MHHLAYLTACYWLGMRYHSGQWSKGYRLLCLADQRGRREHSALNIGRIAGDIEVNGRISTLHPHGGEFRRVLAYYLRKLRKYRFDL